MRLSSIPILAHVVLVLVVLLLISLVWFLWSKLASEPSSPLLFGVDFPSTSCFDFEIRLPLVSVCDCQETLSQIIKGAISIIVP